MVVDPIDPFHTDSPRNVVSQNRANSRGRKDSKVGACLKAEAGDAKKIIEHSPCFLSPRTVTCFQFLIMYQFALAVEAFLPRPEWHPRKVNLVFLIAPLCRLLSAGVTRKYLE